MVRILLFETILLLPTAAVTIAIAVERGLLIVPATTLHISAGLLIDNVLLAVCTTLTLLTWLVGCLLILLLIGASGRLLLLQRRDLVDDGLHMLYELLIQATLDRMECVLHPSAGERSIQVGVDIVHWRHNLMDGWTPRTLHCHGD